MNLGVRELRTYSFRKIEKLQQKKFRAFVRHIVPNVPFYHYLFKKMDIKVRKLRRPEDWQKYSIPLVKKEFFRENPKEFIINGPKRKLGNDYLRHVRMFNKWEFFKLAWHPDLFGHVKKYYKPTMLIFSGGTRGNPAPEIVTYQEKFDNLQQSISLIKELIYPHLDKNRVGMNLFPYAPHLAWHAVHHALDAVGLNLNTAAGGYMRTQDLVKMAGSFKPNIFSAMNDYFLKKFLKSAIKKKLKLGKKLLYINGSIPMTEETRKKIKQGLRKLGGKTVTALDMYAATEFKTSLFPECEEKSGYHHVTPLFSAIRLIKPIFEDEHFIYDYEFVQDESEGGVATLWNLGGAGTVLNGYCLGDYFQKIVSSKCPHCKLNVKRIYGIERLKKWS